MKSQSKNNYHVEGRAGWFVVTTRNQKRARAVGVEEFGRGGVVQVRRATEVEISRYVFEKGADALQE